MPANILADMNSLGAGLEDQRALQIALELTKLGLNENDSSPPPPAPPPPSSTTTTNPSAFESEASMMRKSANMTECVPVPSSEHVAEIVGRQGCKIKALRAKTNTYIKTPVRGEEPVFVVTGRKEDVGAAKREILSAAEHFSQIRASRRNNNSAVPGVVPGPTNPSLPGQVTIQVRVPYRVVGLVVGPKGATIKRIQQQTHTYIVTPNRDKEPIFEVTGLPENVDKARQEIEGHIAMRTGGMMEGNLNNHVNNMHNSMGNLNLLHNGRGKGNGLDECRTDFHSNGIDAGFHEISNNLLFSSMYNNKSPNMTNSAFTPYNKALNNNQSNNLLSQHVGADNPSHQDGQIFAFPPQIDSSLSKFGDCHPMSEGLSNGSVGLYDSDEGIGGSPTFDSTPLPLTSASIWSDLSSESQASDYGNLFSSMNSGGSNSSTLTRQNMSLNTTAPCLSLPQLSFSTVGPTASMSNGEEQGQGQGHAHTRSDSCLPANIPTDHSSVRRISSDPLNLASTLVLLQNGSSSTSTSLALSEGSTSVTSSLSLSGSSTTSSLHSGSASSSPTEPSISGGPLAPPPPRGRHCMLCNDGDIVAALVPCGHNMFCMECAKKLVQDSDKHCPICQQAPSQAIRIFS